jgi:hypothetical protein
LNVEKKEGDASCICKKRVTLDSRGHFCRRATTVQNESLHIYYDTGSLVRGRA